MLLTFFLLTIVLVRFWDCVGFVHILICYLFGKHLSSAY